MRDPFVGADLRVCPPPPTAMVRSGNGTSKPAVVCIRGTGGHIGPPLQMPAQSRAFLVPEGLPSLSPGLRVRGDAGDLADVVIVRELYFRVERGGFRPALCRESRG